MKKEFKFGIWEITIDSKDDGTITFYNKLEHIAIEFKKDTPTIHITTLLTENPEIETSLFDILASHVARELEDLEEEIYEDSSDR